jgi:hypothetical protein
MATLHSANHTFAHTTSTVDGIPKLSAEGLDHLLMLIVYSGRPEPHVPRSVADHVTCPGARNRCNTNTPNVSDETVHSGRYMTPRQRKPPELLELHREAEQLFEVLRHEFNVPDVYRLPLQHVEEKSQLPADLAAYTMWQVRLLHHLARPDAITTSEAVITTCSQLAYHLDLLAAEMADTAGRDIILRSRQDLFLAARVIAALDGSVDGPPIELY